MNEVQAFQTKRQINAMKKALHGRNLLMFTIGINSSLRVSDLLALKVADVQGDYIELTEGKTKKKKRFPINASIRKAVNECVPDDAKADDWLFPSRTGNGHIGRVQAFRILNDAADRAGIPINVGTHSMRKTFGKFAYDSGVPLETIMRALNHSSQSQTLRYIGIESEQVDNVYINLNL